MTGLEFVAFDIETTGFDVDDEVTVAGFALPLGCRVFAQRGAHDLRRCQPRTRQLRVIA